MGLIGYLAYTDGNLAPGANITAPSSADMYIADSHMLAVACWRYRTLIYPEQELAFYQVDALNISGQPVPVSEIPGL